MGEWPELQKTIQRGFEEGRIQGPPDAWKRMEFRLIPLTKLTRVLKDAGGDTYVVLASCPGQHFAFVKSLIGANKNVVMCWGDAEDLANNITGGGDGPTTLGHPPARSAPATPGHPRLDSAAATSPTGRLRPVAPVVGDHVIAWHRTQAFYPATIVAFDQSKVEYSVEWDDGDATGKTIPMTSCALDEPPNRELVSEGVTVLFPQGRYRASEHKNDGGEFWFKGVVTAVKTAVDGSVIVSGHHAEVPKRTFRAYQYEFTIPLQKLRLMAWA